MVFANHNFEMSIVSGLSLQETVDLKCISIPNVYSYPYNNTRIYTHSESYRYNTAEMNSVSFCNIVIVKEIWSTLSFIWKTIKCISSFKGNRVEVIINTPSNAHLIGIRIAKLFTRKTLTQTVIIPDIPTFITSMDNCNAIKKAILNYTDNLAMRLTSRTNGIVILTEAMLDFFNPNINHIVMEGIIDLNKIKYSSGNDNDTTPTPKIILYTGTLRRIFGIMNLVNAFKKIPDKDVELWICGAGDALDSIIDASKSDNRIKYFGVVDSLTALELQRKAMILVNPRTSEGEYTKYSFPSKTIEYMMTGKPVIINRLPGIPKEYFNYVFTPKDETVVSLYECLLEVLHMNNNERLKRGKAAQKYIYEKKNSDVQTKRIIDLIEKY